jgi:small-conductance mechanosensitive channel
MQHDSGLLTLNQENLDSSIRSITPMQDFWGDTRMWLISSGILAGAIGLALVTHFILFLLAERFLRQKGKGTEFSFTKRAKKPARFIFPLLALFLAIPLAPLPENLKSILQHALGLGVIASVGWAIVILAELAGDMVSTRYTLDSPDNLTARKIRTQAQVLQRVVILTVSIVTAAAMLMTFPAVRHVGMSLLASAGLAGLIVGMAARSTLSSLIAGIQVALTQPIRIDDAVVLEGEWGWIEEINTTYVVVRLWDLRRLIVPLNYFIEKPFQNWTRTTADILGTVLIYADYTVPVQELREELHRILETTELWDRRTWALQVTDATESSIQIRALMSARNGPSAFDLRCYVREKLVQYLKDRYPLALPKRREQQIDAVQN